MPNGFIPSWLKAADPAAEYARGMGLGLEAASQRAAQQFQQQRLAQEAQQAAARQAQTGEEWQAEFALQQQQAQEKSQAAAQKFAAMKQYQDAVAGGMDPMQAILQYLPGVTGQAPVEAAAIRAQMQKPAPTWSMEELAPGVSAAVSTAGRISWPPRAPTGPAEWHEETRFDDEGKPYQVQVSTTGKEEAAARAPSATAGKVTPTAAANLMSRISEMAATDPSITNLVPQLKAVIIGGLPKAKAKEQDFPVAPARKEDRKVDQPYRLPKGIFIWTAEGWQPYAE